MQTKKPGRNKYLPGREFDAVPFLISTEVSHGLNGDRSDGCDKEKDGCSHKILWWLRLVSGWIPGNLIERRRNRDFRSLVLVGGEDALTRFGVERGVVHREFLIGNGVILLPIFNFFGRGGKSVGQRPIIN